VHCEWYNSAFYSDSGQLISVLSLVLDVTERFKFLEVLRQSEERFRIAAESASDLIYEWDIETGIVLWFGHVDEHLEYEKGDFRGQEQLGTVSCTRSTAIESRPRSIGI
jgi:PAS domain-containing protein